MRRLRLVLVGGGGGATHGPLPASTPGYGQATSESMRFAINVADLRLAARRRLPRAVFDYIDGGADAEWTLRENARAFDDVMFRPRSAVATPQCDLRTTVLGESVELPVLLAPVGSSRMFYPRGEEVAARAAGETGTIYTLSTLSGCAVRDVKAATRGPVWYQLYVIGGRDVALAGIERAKSCGCSALVVTIDTPVAGLRERDVRNGVKELVSGAPFAMFPYLFQFLARPRWLAGYLRDGGLMQFPNIVLKDGPMPYADVGAALEQAMVCWDDFAWIRQAWQGPIVAKGVHTADDARRAIDHGVAALVVSNHGGRQLDGVAPTLRVLPEVVAAAGGQIEVLLDGGIRRGSDVVKALCLGARAVLIGRAYLWGLAANGSAGVKNVFDVLRGGIDSTLLALGRSSIGELSPDDIIVPAEFSRGLHK